MFIYVVTDKGDELYIRSADVSAVQHVSEKESILHLSNGHSYTSNRNFAEVATEIQGGPITKN